MQNDITVQSTLTGKKTFPVKITEKKLWIFFIAAVIVKCAYFQFSTKLNAAPFYSTVNLNMLLATFTTIFFIISIVILIFNKKRLLALIFINLFLTLILIADTFYYRYYYNAITIPVLYQIGLVGSVGDSIKSLLKISDILYIFDIPLYIAGFITLKNNSEGIVKIPILKRFILSIAIFAVSFGVFQFSYSNSDKANFPYDNNYVINNLGIFYFHYYDTKRFIVEHFFTDDKLSAEEAARVEKYYSDKKVIDSKKESKYKGVAKGKNLIVVQLEAFQQFVINRKFNDKEITPNLNKFINESAYFENYYYQTGNGNTSDAEFLTNTSLYPIQQGAIYFRYPTNTYESTANLLKAQGYDTYVFHANNPSFWNRTVMYKSLGFDNFISSNDYKLDEQIGWGLGDKSFFKQSLDKIDISKPFYGFFITLTSHHPFSYFEDYKGFDVGKYEKTFLGNYIKAVNYVDSAIGQFLDDLKKRGLYDNSVIVIYGDHNAILKDQADVFNQLMDYGGSEFDWTILQKDPCFIHYPGMDKTGVQKITAGQIDILPTVANLMDFDVPHALGKDLFNTDKGYAVLRSSSVITDDFIYINSEDKVYSTTGKILNKKDYEKTIEEYQNQLKISDIILAKNAFKQK